MQLGLRHHDIEYLGGLGQCARRLGDGAGADGTQLEHAVDHDGRHRDRRRVGSGDASSRRDRRLDVGYDVQPVLSGRHRPRDLRLKCGPQGERQRVGGDDLAVGRLAERIPAPALEGEYGRLERAPAGGQLVAAAHGGDASEHSCLLQLAQAVAQDVRGDSRESELQVAVAASACEQVANDEQSPPIADPLERPGDAAVLPKPTRLACGQREPSTPRSTRRPVRRPARP